MSVQRYLDIMHASCRFLLSRWFIKRWRTEYIHLPPYNHIMYVNPLENRGRILCMLNGLTQPRLNIFWQSAIRDFQPTLVLDVGVNYGECLYSVRYPERCKIIGVEANLNLKPYIERSRKHHPDRERIHLVYAIASDVEQAKQTFYINKYWSGMSAAAIHGQSATNMYQRQSIKAITIDSLLKNRRNLEERILFKMDVEGNEQKVLLGMLQSLKQCQQALGIIEFDSKYLIAAGTEIDEYLRFLQDHFNVYIYMNDSQLLSVSNLTLAALQQCFKKKNIHTDFILASEGAELPAMDIKVANDLI
jgi:FkbM family methyltransferase